MGVESVTGEFDLIARIRSRVRSRDDVLLGIGDDAALLRVPSNHDLVVSTDTLNVGVHFPHDTAPADIGWKALAVNLSDLAAMGATPAWCTLALSLPDADTDWLDGFLDGFCALADVHDVALIGGDTTRGPLSITITAHGLVPHGTALRRDGAQAGDDIWISGTLGDAAAGLAFLNLSPVGVRGCAGESPIRASSNATAPCALAGARAGVRGWAERSCLVLPVPHPSPLPEGEGDKQLLMRLNRPTPRIALGIALRGVASACIDISDGLAADLGHVLRASGVGAELELAALPMSAALREFDLAAREAFQLSGGDDYELCFTAPSTQAGRVRAAAAAVDTRVTRIGRIHGSGLRLRAADGTLLAADAAGYEHFVHAPVSENKIP